MAQLAESRQAIDDSRAAIKEKLNVKKQFGTLVRRKPKAVFAGSAVAALAATLLLRRPRKVKKNASKPLRKVLLGWLVLAVKPTAKKWLAGKLKTYAREKLSSFSRPSHAPRQIVHEATPRLRG